MQYVNLTPHAINMNDGTEYPPSGQVARRGQSYETVEGGYKIQWGEVENLPEPHPNTKYIVSLVLFDSVDRDDLVAPASSHPETKRNEKGHIVSVPGFIVK